MNSSGVVVTYVGRMYDGRLVNFTVIETDDSTGAPSHTHSQNDNSTVILIIVLAGVLGPLIIVFIILVIVILVVQKVCRITFRLIVVFVPTFVGILLKLRAEFSVPSLADFLVISV